jgi:hypothetical protein
MGKLGNTAFPRQLDAVDKRGGRFEANATRRFQALLTQPFINKPVRGGLLFRIKNLQGNKRRKLNRSPAEYNYLLIVPRLSTT